MALTLIIFRSRSDSQSVSYSNIQRPLRSINLLLDFAVVLAFVFNCRSRWQTYRRHIILLKIAVAIPARKRL